MDASVHEGQTFLGLLFAASECVTDKPEGRI